MLIVWRCCNSVWRRLNILQAADYTAESWQALQTAKNAAQKLLAGTYTEADLQAADKALAAAIAGLQLLNPDTKPSPSPDAKTITVSFSPDW